MHLLTEQRGRGAENAVTVLSTDRRARVIVTTSQQDNSIMVARWIGSYEVIDARSDVQMIEGRITTSQRRANKTAASHGRRGEEREEICEM